MILQLHLDIRILNIQTGILDYLREGFPWPARPYKHTESNSLKHTLKYTDGTGVSDYLQGLVVWPALHRFKCRSRKTNNESSLLLAINQVDHKN